MDASLRVRSRSTSLQCPYCHAGLETHEASRTCGGCGATYHDECLDQLGGCATLGCVDQGWTQRPAAAPLHSASGSARRLVHGVVAGSALGALALGALVVSSGGWRALGQIGAGVVGCVAMVALVYVLAGAQGALSRDAN